MAKACFGRFLHNCLLLLPLYIKPLADVFTTGPGSVVIDGEADALSEVSLSCRFIVPDRPGRPVPVELLFKTSLIDIVSGT